MLWLFSIFFAVAMPLSGLTVNNKFHLREIEPSGSAGGHELQKTYVNDDFEVSIQAVKLPSLEIAQKKMEVSLASIQNLYKARVNPYEGQVSDLVQCGPDLMPKTTDIVVAGGAKAKLLVGGANARKMLGACAKDQLEYWAAFFQFYYEPQNLAVEVRIFEKKRGSLADAQKKLRAISEQLFAKTGAPL